MRWAYLNFPLPILREVEMDNTREGIIRRMRKEVVGCVQAVVGNEKFLVKYEDGKIKEMISSSLHFYVRKRRLRRMIQNQTLPKKKRVDC